MTNDDPRETTWIKSQKRRDGYVGHSIVYLVIVIESDVCNGVSEWNSGLKNHFEFALFLEKNSHYMSLFQESMLSDLSRKSGVELDGAWVD